MIGEPFVAASAEEDQQHQLVKVPVAFHSKPATAYHSLRYNFEPEGVDKSCGVLVPPEPGASDGTVVFGGASNNGQEYHFKSTEMPSKECDYILSIGNGRCTISKLQSTHILRYTRKSRRKSEQILHQALLGTTARTHMEHDDEVNRLEEELFNDF